LGGFIVSGLPVIDNSHYLTIRLPNCVSPNRIKDAPIGAEKGGAAVTSEESRLIEKAKRGNTAAYERLVRTHEAVAFRTACLITGDVQEAEDAAQEGVATVTEQKPTIFTNFNN
jgi:hypothetical protein